MDEEHKEALNNLRVAYQETLYTLRHNENLLFSILAFLIPISTAGFIIDVEKHELFVAIIGFASITSWLYLFYINHRYSIPFLKDNVAYAKRLQDDLNKLNELKSDKIALMEHLTPRKRNFYNFFVFVGCGICLMWGFYLIWNYKIFANVICACFS
jgi:hypothetical protein